MENATEVEPKEEKAVTPGIGTKQPVKKPVPKTVNTQNGKTATVKEEPVKKTASVKENPNEMVLNPIVESELELPVIKNKKGKKSDKIKVAKTHTLCKLVKKDFLKKHFSEYRGLVANPEWVCRKCGRVANDPKLLCKPIQLS